MLRDFMIAMAIAGAGYFCWALWYTRKTLYKMTAIERANARINEAKAREQRKPVGERLRLALHRYGFITDLEVSLAVIIIGALAITAVFVGIGIPQVLALTMAVPSTVFGVMWFGSIVGSRRQVAFNKQLVQALNLIAAAVEAGNGITRAIESVIPTLNDPLRRELSAAMDAAVASKNIVDPLRDLVERYPSRGLEMLVAALEIDQEKGGKIEPALRQASEALARDFELGAEATAEISQTRSEFFTVIAIMGFIMVGMVGSGGDQVTAAYKSPMGVIAGIILVPNFLFGVYRAMRMLGRAGKGLS